MFRNAVYFLFSFKHGTDSYSSLVCPLWGAVRGDGGYRRLGFYLREKGWKPEALVKANLGCGPCSRPRVGCEMKETSNSVFDWLENTQAVSSTAVCFDSERGVTGCGG
ncbi:unnamed protein product, partial [Ectocarpus sp. 8 AP-2014]